MARRQLLRPAFAQTGGAGRLGSLASTLSAGSLIQVLAAAAGFVTVPLLVTHLGAPSYGVLTVILSLAPWLTLVDAAIHPATRLLVGESRRGGVAKAPRSLISSAVRMSYGVVTLNSATVVVAVIVLPVVALFGADGTASRETLIAGILAFALPIVGSGPGAVYLGALEGVGRTVAAAVLNGAGPLVALPLTVAVVLGDGGLVAFCLAQGVAVSLPRYVAWAYWRWKPSLAPDDVSAPRLRIPLVLQMLVLSLSFMIQTGFDPVIVSSNLGSEPAGAFGLANRIVQGAIIPVLVLTPLFGANLAAARRSGWSRDRSQELRRLLVQASLAGLAAGALVTGLGPFVAHALGAGRLATDLSLYLAGGCYVFAAYASTPLMLAFSGPHGLSRSVRVSLVLAAANLVISVVAVGPWGVSGPMWASAIVTAAATCYWLLMWWRHPDWLGQVHQVGSRNREEARDGEG